MKKREDVKETMQLHSLAKVEFYGNYLKRYLRILYRSQYINHINIYDVFCGMGIYKDGHKGSPIVAFDIVKEVFDECHKCKKVKMIVNDSNIERIKVVKGYIDSNNSECCCDIEYYNEDADSMLLKIQERVAKTLSTTRNLIFIDPYGYKQIKKDVIYNLMKNGRTEIILFLPISHMYRFTQYAVENEDLSQYRPLSDFVKSFFHQYHPIVQGTDISIMQYISYLRDALTFSDSYYATSYHIERSKKSYFSLFFLTSNLLGYEKTLEVKWELDEEDGNGFQLPQQEGDLFSDWHKEQAKIKIFNDLYNKLKSYLAVKRTNCELYRFVLHNEYLPKHANMVLRKMQNERQIEILSLNKSKTVRKGVFYIGYDRKDDPVLEIRLKYENNKDRVD